MKKFKLLKDGRSSIDAEFVLDSNLIINKSEMNSISGGNMFCIGRHITKCRIDNDPTIVYFESTCKVRVGGDKICINKIVTPVS